MQCNVLQTIKNTNKMIIKKKHCTWDITIFQEIRTEKQYDIKHNDIKQENFQKNIWGPVSFQLTSKLLIF